MPTILCIDDNPTGLATRKTLLTSMNYCVVTAEDAMTGLALLFTRHGMRCGFCGTVSEHIDAVVLDYLMPGMDGEAVASIIRNEQPDLPIVLLTGVPRDLLESRLVSLVDAVVIKGEPAEVLLTVLERLTGTKREKIPAKKAASAGEGNALRNALLG